MSKENISKTLNEQQVADFLDNHRDFFARHHDLLEKMELPIEQSEKILSLPGKQAEILRKKNRDMRKERKTLYETSEKNQQIFNKSRRLVAELLKADSLEELSFSLTAGLEDNFQLEAASLMVFSEHEDLLLQLRFMQKAEALQSIPSIMSSKLPICGILRESELEFLFPGDGDVGSAAVIPLFQDKQIIGLLALGSYDTERFRVGLGTIFLEFIGEVVSALLAQLKKAELPEEKEEESE